LGIFGCSTFRVYVPGPTCVRILGDFGADIIKIEAPAGVDPNEGMSGARDGYGQWVQASLLEAQIAMMDFQAARYLIDGVAPGQAGNDHPYSTPMGVFQASDDFINIGVGGDGQWRALCVSLERTDLAHAPEYATGEQRFRNRSDRFPHPNLQDEDLRAMA
jgi:crotonobetainyl-CoA:carnitine CoA-transferase CaiB-like acyl-CoA transferase